LIAVLAFQLRRCWNLFLIPTNDSVRGLENSVHHYSYRDWQLAIDRADSCSTKQNQVDLFGSEVSLGLELASLALLFG
jgi:hypothetical protein